MNKLTNRALKDLLNEIEDQLNKHEVFDEEYWTYKLELKKDTITCKIYDDEWLEYGFTVEAAENIIGILKSFINYLYENEINDRQSYIKANKGYYNRKHKSLNTWFQRDNREKIDKIVEDLADRYSTSKKVESEILYYKDFVHDFYCALNNLVSDWKTSEIKEAIFKKIEEFNIHNVGVTYIEDTIIIMKSHNEGENIIDKFDIVIDSYSNKNAIVNQAINRLRKMVA